MSVKKRISKEIFKKIFVRREKAGRRAARQPQDALLFDTISIQAMLAVRGQNPFPEEEGELCSMNTRIRERPLLMR